MNKKEERLRRAKRGRAKIAASKMNRLTVYRSNNNIYAQLLSAEGARVLAQASS